MNREDAYNEGRKAFIDGVPGYENPYGPGRALISFGFLAAAWDQGWDDAERDAETVTRAGGVK